MTTPVAPSQVLITVAVCTHNRARMLERALREVGRQQAATSSKSELLVIDSASSDDTPDLIARLMREIPMRSITMPSKGLALARNAAISSASGRYLAFLDDDAVPSDGWLEYLASTIHNTQPPLIAGSVELGFEKPPPPWLRRSDRAQALLSGLDLGEQARPLHEGEYPVGANMAVDTAVARGVHGFNLSLGRIGRKLLSMEEVDFASRVRARSGMTGVWAPGASVVHYIPADRITRRFLIRRAYWQGRSHVRWIRLSIDTTGRQVLPAVIRLAAALRHFVLAPRRRAADTGLDRVLDGAYEIGRCVGYLEGLTQAQGHSEAQEI